MSEEVFGLAGENDASAIQNGDLIAFLSKIGHVMCGEKNLHFPGESGQEISKDATLPRVHARSGFVQQDGACFVDESGSNTDATQLPTGEPLCFGVGLCGQIDTL